ncbi:MAG: hypothetical protein Tsb0010_00570 [Parvularculaceae bacterium]
MEDEDADVGIDERLRFLTLQDLSAHSVSDLEQRIAILQEEIKRSEAALNARQDFRAAAESVFKI